jgi:hypothetical protein
MTRRRGSPSGKSHVNDCHGDHVAIGTSVKAEPTLEAEVESLSQLPISELRAAWSRCLGEPASNHGRDLLRRQLAWKLQARAHGGLSSDTRRRIRRLYQTFQDNPRFTPSPTFDLPPGTILTRKWQGVRHRVQVMHDGFAYAGERFESLSEVARRITGTRWSGPAFFGLKASAKESR